MADQEIALIAHLMRRAGFGASRDELEIYAAKGYEATVEELLASEIVERSQQVGHCLGRREKLSSEQSTHQTSNLALRENQDRRTDILPIMR